MQIYTGFWWYLLQIFFIREDCWFWLCLITQIFSDLTRGNTDKQYDYEISNKQIEYTSKMQQWNGKQ